MRLFTRTKFLIMLSAVTVALAQTPATTQPAKPPAKPTVTESAKPTTPPAAAATPAPVVVAPDAVVLTVGNEKFTRAQCEELLSALPDNMRAAAAAPGPGRRQVGEQIAELKSIAVEARRRKMDQAPGIQQLIAIQTDNVLAGALANRVTDEIQPDEPPFKAYYDAHES